MRRVRLLLVLLLPGLVLLGWLAFSLRPRPLDLPAAGSPLLQASARQMARAVQRAEQRSGGALSPQDPDDFSYFALLAHKRNRRLLDSVEPDYTALAAQFGSDPRYLQLVCGTLYGDDEPSPERQALLLDAIRAGSADETLYSLVDLDKLAGSAPDEAVRLAQAAIALNPDNAHFHYQLALLRFKAGDRAGGFAGLRAGNAAPENYLPPGFPASEILALDRELLASADRRAQLVYARLYSNTAFPLLLSERARMNELLAATAPPLTRQELDDIYAFNRRAAGRAAPGWLAQLVGHSTAQATLDAAIREANRLGLEAARLGAAKERASKATAQAMQPIMEREGALGGDMFARDLDDIAEEEAAGKGLREAADKLPALDG